MPWRSPSAPVAREVPGADGDRGRRLVGRVQEVVLDRRQGRRVAGGGCPVGEVEGGVLLGLQGPPQRPGDKGTE